MTTHHRAEIDPSRGRGYPANRIGPTLHQRISGGRAPEGEGFSRVGGPQESPHHGDHPIAGVPGCDMRGARELLETCTWDPAREASDQLGPDFVELPYGQERRYPDL